MIIIKIYNKIKNFFCHHSLDDIMKKFSQKEIDKFIKMLDFSKIEGRVVPVIAQDYKTNEVLMLAFANEEAVRQSLETGLACYYSRSRKKLWKNLTFQ
ncbi:Phosphoribosyl-AMP cyclohydrolase [subsurface metagenome]